MDYIKSLTIELIPVIMVGILSGIVAGMGAYMAVRDDMTTVQVNQGNMIEKLDNITEEYKKVKDVQYMQGVRIALIEDRAGR